MLFLGLRISTDCLYKVLIVIEDAIYGQIVYICIKHSGHLRFLDRSDALCLDRA